MRTVRPITPTTIISSPLLALTLIYSLVLAQNSRTDLRTLKVATFKSWGVPREDHVDR
jgi:hypothetical protein